MDDRESQLRKLGELLDDIRVGMLTTVAEDGRLASRPLGMHHEDFDGRLWFLTHADSPRLHDIERNPRVNVSCSSHLRNVFVSISGQARLVDDRARLERIWNPAMKAFFPEGKDDPRLRLLCVEVETAEYWDGPGSWIGKALYLIGARVTHDPHFMNRNELIDLQQGQTRPPPSHSQPGL